MYGAPVLLPSRSSRSRLAWLSRGEAQGGAS